MRLLPVLLALVPLVILDAATAVDTQPFVRENEFGELKDLPSTVKAAADKVSLVADFAGAENGLVALFLINRSNEPFMTTTQYGGVDSKRESPDAKNVWRRCDPHFFGECATGSYSGGMLEPGKFYRWVQQLDSTVGEVKPVRFRLIYEAALELVSNVGQGRIDPADLELARYDGLAMRSGPFEDVVAVATKRVNSTTDLWVEAIEGLARFGSHKETFGILKEVIQKARDEVRNSRPYESALRALGIAQISMIRSAECWEFMANEAQDRNNPYQREALSWLVDRYDWKKEELLPILEAIISDVRHPAITTALSVYPRVARKSAARVRLMEVMGNPDCKPIVKVAARDSYEGMFPNPFIKVEVSLGEGNMSSNLVFGVVRITNISPEAISIGYEKAEDMLTIRATDQYGNELETEEVKAPPPNPSREVKPISVGPGEVIELHDVDWSKRLNVTELSPGTTFSVRVGAKTLGLWSVPAHADEVFTVNSDDLMRAAGGG